MIPQDSGPLYFETRMGRMPVEPWNTFSNVVFLLIVVYWARQVYPHGRQHVFLACALPVLFIGFVGGTVYHGTRSHDVWLVMDWLPIVLLCGACSVLFARRAGLAWAWVLLLFMAPFLVRYLMFLLKLPAAVVMNGGYAAMGAAVLYPILLHLRRNAWQHYGPMLVATLCFAAAVLFRSVDHQAATYGLWMGSHWLWHVLGALAVHFLVTYIHRDDLSRAGMVRPSRA